MDYHIPIKQLVDWFQADIVSRKRYEIQQLLLRLMVEQNIDIEALNLPVLSLKPGGYSDENDMVDDEEDPICDNQEDEDMMEDDYPEPENELEDGEYEHNEEEDDEEEYLDEDDLEHEMDEDEDEYRMHSEDEEMSDNEMGEEDKELDEMSSLHGGTGKRNVDLKHYRIPRLRKDMDDDV